MYPSVHCSQDMEVTYMSMDKEVVREREREIKITHIQWTYFLFSLFCVSKRLPVSAL